MPKSLTRYSCVHCRSEFVSFADASVCEARPIPEQLYKEGDTCSFEDESTLFGSRYSYSGDSGPVLYAYLARQGERHIWVYVLKGRYDTECLVLLAEIDGSTRLFSPAEYKYKPGYAEVLRNKHQTF